MRFQFDILIDTYYWIRYCVETQQLEFNQNEYILRILKGVYKNKERLQTRFLSKFDTIEMLEPLCDYLLNNFDKTSAFSYKEIFEMPYSKWSPKRLLFKYISIPEMIQNLGAKRLKVAGKEVTRKCFDKEGNRLADKNFHSVYVTYEIDLKSLFNDKVNVFDYYFIYAVKCWCTTTQKEHWIWIDEQYKDDPLEAIASTFRFHENVIPHIKELKRQGDIMLVELNQFVEPQGEIVPLTAEQYFKYLTIET